MMDSIKNILPIIFLITIISSCNKNNLAEKFVFTDEELQYIPFEGGEQVLYYNPDYDEEIILISNPVSQSTYESPIGGHGSDEYYEWDNRSITLNGFGIKVIYSMTNWTNINGSKSLIKFYWGYNIGPLVHGTSMIPMDTTDNNPIISMYDSLLINQVMYYDVYHSPLGFNSFEEDDPVIEEYIYPIKFFYSLHFGIVKFNMSDSTSWELKNIKW